jgi:hypothetical protein
VRWVVSAGLVVLGVGEGGGVGGVEAGGEAVDLVAGPGDLGELAGEFLDLCPEVPYLLDRDAGVHEQAPQHVGCVGRGASAAACASPLMAATTQAQRRFLRLPAAPSWLAKRLGATRRFAPAS